jgi:predicted amino acid-binding ACT domain protein
MPDSVRRIEYFYVMAPDKPGVGAAMLKTLKDAGINLLAFSGFPKARQAQIDFVPEDPTAFRAVARAAKWKLVGPKRGFVVTGDDRPGAVADLMARLAEAKINVTAIDAVCAGAGRYGAILWVAQRDVGRAASVLGATG